MGIARRLLNWLRLRGLISQTKETSALVSFDEALAQSPVLTSVLAWPARCFALPMRPPSVDEYVMVWLYMTPSHATPAVVLSLSRDTVERLRAANIAARYLGIELVFADSTDDCDGVHDRFVRIGVKADAFDQFLRLPACRFENSFDDAGVYVWWYSTTDEMNRPSASET